jgi:hypothetical protein
VYLPTIVSGRVIWHLSYTEEASAVGFTQSYREFQRAAVDQQPTYRVRGILIDGFDSTTKSLRTLFPGAHLGHCLRHAINKRVNPDLWYHVPPLKGGHCYGHVTVCRPPDPPH